MTAEYRHFHVLAFGEGQHWQADKVAHEHYQEGAHYHEFHPALAYDAVVPKSSAHPVDERWTSRRTSTGKEAEGG